MPSSPTPTSSPLLHAVTFNLLAPCYKRLHHPDGHEPPDRERNHLSLWTSRLEAILSLISSISPPPDVVALQEVWFHPHFLSLLQSALSPTYHIFYARRPSPKEDGLATLIRRQSPVLSNPRHHAFLPLATSDRIALAVTATLHAPHAIPSPILLLNTHLTFPHHALDISLRLSQADALATYAISTCHPEAPILILGDFNSDNSSRVARRLRADRFVNCYAHLNGKKSRPTTHFNHRGQSVFVDHVFLRAPAVAPDSPRDPFSSDDEPMYDHQIDNATAVAAAATHCGKHRRSQSALRVEDAPFDSEPSLSPSPSPPPSPPPSPTPSPTHPVRYVPTLDPVRSAVFPETLPAELWPSSYAVSDHRPLGILFRPVARRV